MKVNTLKLRGSGYPSILKDIPTPPATIYWAGAPPEEILARPRVAIVGSRKASAYGRQTTKDLGNKLAREGVVIISGLAFGIDANAHKAALDVGGCTLAILPSPIEQIAPAAHHSLAEQILRNGGALASEYVKGTGVYKENFIIRNRIVSGLADVLVIAEAAKNSGSLHTARFALEQGKTVMAVPGNINSPTSEGCNNLIKSGALPVTGADDIFFALDMRPKTRQQLRIFSGTADQQRVLDLISEGIQTQEELALASNLAGGEFSSILTSLELQGYIRPMGAGVWTLS